MDIEKTNDKSLSAHLKNSSSRQPFTAFNAAIYLNRQHQLQRWKRCAPTFVLISIGVAATFHSLKQRSSLLPFKGRSIKSFINFLHKKKKQNLSFKKRYSNEIAILQKLHLANKQQGNKLSHLKTRRSYQALISQEHLLRCYSHILLQQPIFVNALSKKEGARFKTVLDELRGMVHLFIEPIADLKPWQKISFQRVESLLVKLKVGSSLWIYLCIAQHSMMMRLTKSTEKSYEMRYSNTGTGAESQEEFHPRKELKNGKVLYQTTFLIRNISQAQLIERHFFSDLLKIAEKEEHPPVSSLYAALKTLGAPGPLPFDQYPNYWSRMQLGTSCTPSCIWAMAKTLLLREELQEVKTDQRMIALTNNYQSIKEGWDPSRTAQILVLDMVEKLKGGCRKRGEPHPEIFDAIESELKEALEIDSAQVVVKKRSRWDFDKLKDGSGQIRPVQAQLAAKDSSLSAHLCFQEMRSTHTYRICADQDLFDSSYLLYFYVANGDCDKSAQALQQVLHQVLAMQKQNPHVSHIAPTFTKKALQTGLLLLDLASQLSKIDNTRSGIAKTVVLLQLAALAISLLAGQDLLSTSSRSLSFKNAKGKTIDLSFHAETIKNQFNHARYKYANMNVEFYLPKDHLWVSAHHQLALKKD